MSARLTNLWVWKKLVVSIVLAGVVTVFVFIIQSDNWLLTKTRRSLILHATTATTASSRNISATKSFFLASTKLKNDDKVIMRRYPYVRDVACQNFSLSLYEDGTFPVMGLVSFPGSGNTWTRHLIHLASGVYTGSFYFDMELFARGFMGERETWYSGRTIVQKFHEKYNERMDVNRAILLIREPFPAILSFANYLEAGHTGNAYHLPYHHKDWPSFLLQSAYNWLSLAKSWIESPANLLVIHYELLWLRPVENLQKICKFLNHTCPYLLSPCFKEKIEGSFHRSNSVSKKIFKSNTERAAKYPTEIKNVISRGIDHLNHLLRVHGYQEIPLNLYQHYAAANLSAPAISPQSKGGNGERGKRKR